MKHATAQSLDQLEPLLADLRRIEGLMEKSRGVFYRGSKAFLHFHEDPAGLFADMQGSSGGFERFAVNTVSERDQLVIRASGDVGATASTRTGPPAPSPTPRP